MQQIQLKNILEYTQEEVYTLILKRFRINACTNYLRMIQEMEFVKSCSPEVFQSQLKTNSDFRVKIQKIIESYL